MKYSFRQKLSGNQGASIVVALVFFLICALIGSVVLTAATLNTQATATYKAQRQNEFTVSSASQVLAQQLRPLASSAVAFSYDGSDTVPSGTRLTDIDTGTVAASLWTWGTGNAEDIWNARAQGHSFILGNDMPVIIEVAGFDSVYALIEVDRDFTVRATLSLDGGFDRASPYNETVEARCIPHYDARGRLLAVQWENPVITKVESGPQERSS